MDERDRVEDELDYSGSGREANFFVVHVSDSMLRPVEIPVRKATGSKKTKKTNMVREVLESIFEVIKQQMLTKPESMAGVSLVGTAKSKSGDENLQENIYNIIPLGQPSSEELVEFKHLLKDESLFNEICKPNPDTAASGYVKLSELFFMVNRSFKENSPNAGLRRLTIITDNDDPCPDLATQAKERAWDLVQLDVMIVPFLLSRKEVEFDSGKFWSDLPTQSKYSTNTEENSSISTRPISELYVKEWFLYKQATKRVEFSAVIEIGKERPGQQDMAMPPTSSAQQAAKPIEIGVKGYVSVIQQVEKKAADVYMAGDRPMHVVANTTHIDSTGSDVKKEDSKVVREIQFGPENNSSFTFTKEQFDKIKNLGEDVMGKRIIRVIGFKPMQLYKPYSAFGSIRFLYPSDSQLSNSTRAFTSLYTSMLEKDVFALAWVVTKSNSMPRIMALIPSVEERDKRSQAQITPPGFFMIPLAFKDEARPVTAVFPDSDPFGKKREMKAQLVNDLVNILVPDEGVETPSLRQLARKKAYEPAQFPNIRLQRFYETILESELGNVNFEEADQEDEGVHEDIIEDPAVPDYETIMERSREFVDQFNQKCSENKHVIYKRSSREEDKLTKKGATAKKKK